MTTALMAVDSETQKRHAVARAAHARGARKRTARTPPASRGVTDTGLHLQFVVDGQFPLFLRLADALQWLHLSRTQGHPRTPTRLAGRDGAWVALRVEFVDRVAQLPARHTKQRPVSGPQATMGLAQTYLLCPPQLLEKSAHDDVQSVTSVERLHVKLAALPVAFASPRELIWRSAHDRLADRALCPSQKQSRREHAFDAHARANSDSVARDTQSCIRRARRHIHRRSPRWARRSKRHRSPRKPILRLRVRCYIMENERLRDPRVLHAACG